MSNSASTNSSLFSTLLPIVTFVLGYLLSQVDRFRDTVRKRRNTKRILFHELKDNYRLLNSVMPDYPEGLPDHAEELVASVGEQISLSVYSAYLGQLDMLPTEELDAIHQAYVALRQFADAARIFRTPVADSSAPSALHPWTSKTGSLLPTMVTAHEKTECALRLLPGGPQVLRKQETRTGEALKRYEAARECSDKGNEDGPTSAST